LENADLAILPMAPGSFRRARDEDGQGKGLKVGSSSVTIWPFPTPDQGSSARAGKIIVPEMNLGQ